MVMTSTSSRTLEVDAPQVSSNWKALRQSMTANVAAQPSSSQRSSIKRKRSESSTVLEKQANAADSGFARGSTKLDNAVAAVDTKGKGKAKETVLGEAQPSGRKAETGKYVSLDCEFVGLYDPASDHAENSLARVSIVNYHGAIVLDTFVAQREKVGDWRTWVSGVRAEDVQNAPTYEEVQKQVAELIKDRILVGHAVYNDLKVLLLKHPGNMIRDTAKYGPLRELAGTKRPSLKNLAKKVLNIDIQEGAHSSVTDAQATMAIYRSVHKQWESSLRSAGAPGAVSRNSKKQKVVQSGRPNQVNLSEHVGSPASITAAQGPVQASRARVKGGPAAASRKPTFGLASTLAKHKDWWSSGTID